MRKKYKKKYCKGEKTYDLQKYIDLHVGPEYYFHYKVGNTAIIVYNCLIFGPLMPLLYLTGLVSVGIQYLVERISLTYFYRVPLNFDD